MSPWFARFLFTRRSSIDQLLRWLAVLRRVGAVGRLSSAVLIGSKVRLENLKNGAAAKPWSGKRGVGEVG